MQVLDGGFVQVVDARLLDVGLGGGQGSHTVPPDQRAGASLHLLQRQTSGDVRGGSRTRLFYSSSTAFM